MHPSSSTLAKLFRSPVEYTIPIFQRRYVWTKERQWKKLWANVQRTAETQLGNPGSTREHFMGAIIVRMEHPADGGRARWSVIDGQQRLITFQLLLDAAEHALRGLPGRAATAAAQLATLIENDPAFRDPDDPTTWLKVRPGGGDFDRFVAAMQRGEQSAELPNGDLIGNAHEFFRGEISDWVTADPSLVEDRAAALANTLQDRLKLVTISVDASDHPNMIFETLNARGTPLQAWDLVKNYLLYEARERGDSDVALYRAHLAPVEADNWWSSQTQLGSHDIDLFLFYWLIMRTRKKVSLADVYRDFQEYATDRMPAEVAADVRTSADAYRAMMTGGFEPAADEHLRRWRGLDIGVSTPIVLWLLENATSSVRIRALQAIESFFVRRMVCGIGVAGLNSWFPQVIGQLADGSTADVDMRLARILASGARETRRWPSDSEFGSALMERPLYEQLSPRPRLRTILEALEAHLVGKHAPVTLKQGLTIEHIMPQNWRRHWPIVMKTEEAQQEAESRRDLIIHSIGNLTLCTTSLGSQMSDGPWKEKRVVLKKYGLLMITNQALDMPGRGWTEKKIRSRSQDLAHIACKVWPSPESLLAD